MNSGRGWHSHFFVCSRPKTGVSGETFPHRPVLERVRKWSGVSVGKQLFVSIFFSQRVDCRYPKARLQNVWRKYWKIWLRRANIESHLSPKVDPILKLSNLGNYANFACFPHKSPNVHAVFKRWTLQFWNTYSILYVHPEAWPPGRS